MLFAKRIRQWKNVMALDDMRTPSRKERPWFAGFACLVPPPFGTHPPPTEPFDCVTKITTGASFRVIGERKQIQSFCSMDQARAHGNSSGNALLGRVSSPQLLTVRYVPRRNYGFEET